MTAEWPKFCHVLSFWPKKLNGVWALDTWKFSAGLMDMTRSIHLWPTWIRDLLHPAWTAWCTWADGLVLRPLPPQSFGTPRQTLGPALGDLHSHGPITENTRAYEYRLKLKHNFLLLTYMGRSLNWLLTRQKSELREPSRYAWPKPSIVWDSWQTAFLAPPHSVRCTVVD